MLLLALGLGGCHPGGNGPYSPQSEGVRNPIEAQQLTLEAATILDRARAKDAAQAASGKPDPSGDLLDRAEKLLRQALTADLYHGPAHNDLGVIYLKQGMLYDAAGEFEWARKLMPGHPDPRMNLALTLERAGRTDEALKTYASALEVYPGHIPTLQALTRLQLRHARADDQTAAHLRTIALEGDSPRWRQWAQSQIVAHPSGKP
jgi:tetratricopeptide (TPR) repeat protein